MSNANWLFSRSKRGAGTSLASSLGSLGFDDFLLESFIVFFVVNLEDDFKLVFEADFSIAFGALITLVRPLVNYFFKLVMSAGNADFFFATEALEPLEAVESFDTDLVSLPATIVSLGADSLRVP